MLSFENFPKIDAHIHFNADRDSLLKTAEDFGFSLITINTEVPFFPSIHKQQELVKKHRNFDPVFLFHLSTISTEHISNTDWADQAIDKIKSDMADGALGVKFWKNIGMSLQRKDESFIMLDDPELNDVFEFLEKQQIPVLGHQGEPRNCWLPGDQMTVKSDREYFASHPEYHMYLHDEYPGYWDHIQARDHVLERHPDLTFIGAHIASLEWNLDEVAHRLDKFPNMAIDLAERVSHLEFHTVHNRNKVIEFFHTYQDRIIYGTDIIDDAGSDPDQIIQELKNRWTRHWLFFSTDQQLSSTQVEGNFRGLDLPESILHKIYRLNALKWYNIPQ